MLERISIYLLSIPAVLIALIFHEVAHGFVAYKLGDPTARAMGRLSLNPLKHLDPIGTICMIFFRFGWARPVPINTRYFKNPRRDMAITALAGPLTNFIIAFLSVPVYLLLYRLVVHLDMRADVAPFLVTLVLYTYYFFFILHSVNLGLGLFNLIPLPPLDGSRILLVFLPPRYYFGLMRYERHITLVLILILFFGSRFGILSTVSNQIGGIMEFLWRLIPGL